MSNMMPKMGPGAQMTPGQQTEDKLKSLRSPASPTDLSMMAQDGEISLQMPIRDYFAKFGVDVDGPVSQLVEMAKKGMQTKSPLAKMQALAGGGGGAPPPAGGAGPMPGPAPGQMPQAPPPKPDFGSLFNR